MIFTWLCWGLQKIYEPMLVEVRFQKVCEVEYHCSEEQTNSACEKLPLNTATNVLVKTWVMLLHVLSYMSGLWLNYTFPGMT